MGDVPGDLARRPLPGDLARLLHDLRGPLNSAVMHAQVLRRLVTADESAADSIRVLLEQLGRLGEMLPAAFAVAALELQQVRRLDLRAVTACAAEREVPGAVVLEPPPWPPVVGDGALLGLAIGQLLRNAVEATAAPAPAPRVSAAGARAEVVLTVRDWGGARRGTSGKPVVRLLHSTKAGHQGLGLAIADRVARLHGGRLAFAAPGDGTVVTLTLRGAVDGAAAGG